jgi:hypothetical protein
MSLPDELVAASVWNQLGASIDALVAAIDLCPDDLWGDDGDEGAFWYVAFHTAFFLDLYVTGSADGFAPPPPFGLEELDPAGVLPPRAYTMDELRAYLRHVRGRAQEAVARLDAAAAARTCTFPWGSLPYLELLLYTARHTQHHAGQLALVLRRAAGLGTPWVGRARI